MPHALCDAHVHAIQHMYPQITALKNLGLNISRAKLESGKKANVFYITDATTSEKITRSAQIEEIRMTIISNMLYYHPVSWRAPHGGIRTLACSKSSVTAAARRLVEAQQQLAPRKAAPRAPDAAPRPPTHARPAARFQACKEQQQQQQQR